MSQQPVEANVVLTADTSDYNSNINASAANTDNFGKSVDSLSSKIDRLAKSAGKKMMGFAAADVGGIVAATAAYGAYEQQMVSLSAQAAILNRTMDGQKSTFNSYASAVTSLRGAFGTTTRDAVQLVSTLSQMGDNTSSVEKLATTFTKLGNATQESSSTLAQSMLQLQRSMGTPQRDTEKYANQLAVLSANSNASANSILQFAQQLAPVGRMVNMSQTDVMGVSTAFQKAGQDGFQAANVFSKMMTDVAYASQSGSPDLKKYANLVGMTVDQFKNLGGTDQFLRIFDSINRQGPAAITTLNRMGLDGMRTVRTVTAMAQQSGGLQSAIDQANGADPDALNRGSDASNTMLHTLTKMRSELTMTGEAFGKNFAGGAKIFLDVIEKMLSGTRELVQGPLGKMAAVVAAIAAPFAAVAGAIMLASKALLVFAGANQMLRNSGTFGFKEGRQGFSAIGRQRMTPNGPIPYGPMGPRGAELEKEGNWFQKGLYNRLNRAGEFSNRFGGGSGGPGFFSRVAGHGAAGAGWLGGSAARLVGMQYTGGTLRGLDNAARRERLFQSPTLRGSVANGWNGARAFTGPMAGFANRQFDTLRTRLFNGTMSQAATANFNPSQVGNAGLAGSTSSLMHNISKASGGFAEAEKASMSFGKGVRMGLGNFTRGMAAMSMNVASTAGGATVMAGRGIVGATGSLAGSAYKGLFNENPWALGIMAGIGGLMAWHAGTKQLGEYSTPDNSGIMNPYLQAGGLSPASSFTPLRRAQMDNKTVNQAMHISATDKMAAGDSAYRLSNKQIKGKSQAAVLSMFAPQFAEMKNDPKALTSLSLDLTHQFGAGDAEKMMTKLAGGNAFNAGDLVDAGVNVKAGGSWFHKLLSGGDPSRTTASNKWADLFGTYQNQVNIAAAQPGDNASLNATRMQGRQFGQALQMVGKQGGTTFNPSYYTDPQTGLSSVQDPKKIQRTSFNQSIFKNMLGIDKLSAKQAEKYTIDPNAKSGNAAAAKFLDQVFSKTTPDELQNRVLSHFKLNEGLTNHAATVAVMGAMKGDNLDSLGGALGLDEKISFMAGGDQLGTRAAKTAIKYPNDENAQYTAVDKAMDEFHKAGQSFATINQNMGGIKAAVGDPSDQRYLLAQAIQGQAHREESWKLPGMSRTGQFQSQIADFTSTWQGAIGDPQQKKIQHAAEDTMQQAAEGQRQYFVGLLTQQREFNISQHRANVDFNVQRDRMDYQYNLSRSRAQDDFHQQEQWQLEDYNRSRAREEFDYQLQRQRATADYNRQMTRGAYEYHLQRKRQEEDYQHSVVQMTKQTALQAADIYKRTPVQSTSSASWLVANAGEQLKQMKDQESNLNKLRKAGLSTDAIQQLKLTDPNNAQQLERMVGDVNQDPKLIKQFNEQVAKRLKAAGALTTDTSSETWREFNRQYRLSRDRGSQDFMRQVDQSHQDFKRNMNQQEADHKRGLERQATDYGIQAERQSNQFHKSMNRAEQDYATTTEQMTTDFNKSMTRAQNDLNRSAKTIDGNFTQILTQATKKLSGHAKAQAQTVLDEFQNVNDNTTGVSTALMKSLAAIFGVEYHAPKLAHASQTNQSATKHQQIGDTRAATGGVLPGFTPGKDVHHFYSPTAGNLHLSGGEAIMRPEWTKAVGGEKAVAEMNAAAIKGQAFAGGGVWRPVATGSYGKEQDEGGFRAVDVGVTNGTPVHAARDGRVTISKDLVGPDPKGRMARDGYHSYGRYIQIAHDTGNTIYAHLSRRLAGYGEEVRGGELIGYSGHTGYTLGRTGDHLHFGANGSPTVYDFMGGSRDYSGQGIAKGAFGGGAAGAAGFALDSVLKSIYGKVEKAMNMSGVHPLEYGQMSGVINKMATKAYMKFVAKYGEPSGLDVGGAPTNVTGNKAIVRDMAAARGWTGIEWDALYKVMMAESGFRNTAQNPTSTAYGMFQFLDKTWPAYGGHKTSDAKLQTKYGLNYIAKRYHDPLGALRHEQQHGWYGDGQIFSGPRTIGVGERGPEMLLPLNDRGAAFIQNLMEKMLPGNAAKSHHTAGYSQPTTVHNMHNYQIDKSTTFSGPITVQANDPNMLINQLKIRARTQALTNAAKGGVKVA